jgi:hypothetical protein
LNKYSQVDDEGRNFSISDFIGHERDDIAHIEGIHYTTKGWQFLVSWRDGTTTYVPLWEMKNSYSIETTNDAVNNKTSNEQSFNWWVPHIQRKCECMIGKLKKNK